MSEETEYVGVRLPKSMRSKLRETAQKEFTSEGSIIKKALAVFFNRKSNKI